MTVQGLKLKYFFFRQGGQTDDNDQSPFGKNNKQERTGACESCYLFVFKIYLSIRKQKLTESPADSSVRRQNYNTTEKGDDNSKTGRRLACATPI